MWCKPFIFHPKSLCSLYLTRGAYSHNFIILENVTMLQLNAFANYQNDQVATIWIFVNPINLFWGTNFCVAPTCHWGGFIKFYRIYKNV